jgi:hypothetical protein
MPEISRFLGIIIAIFYKDHSPPHFHAKYGEYDITVEIMTGVVNGEFPKRALFHVLEWYELYKEELLQDWDLARQGKPLKTIQPLE